jgi:hypothetical protein
MDRKSWPIRLMAVLLVVPAFACADNDEAEVEINEGDEAPAGAAMAPVTAQLQPMGGSMLSGEVVATHGPEDVNVRVTLNGLTEGDEYEAALKYGMCTDAQAHLDDDGPDDDADGTRTDATTPGTTPAAGDATMDDHEPGEEFGDIDLNVTGTTATGSADIDTDDLRQNEPAYLVVTTGGMTDEKNVLACADLSGHGGMNTGAGMGTGTTPAPGTTGAPGAPGTGTGTEPGAAAPGRD